MRKALLVAAACLAAGCEEQSTGITSDPVTVTIETAATVWPGSRVVLRSSAFGAASTDVLVNGSVAAVVVVDSERVAFNLPDSAGAYEIAVVFPVADTVDAGVVNVAGQFLRWDTLPNISANYFITAWPDPHGVRVVGVWSGLFSVDLAHPAVVDTLLPESATSYLCGAGPVAELGTLTLPGGYAPGPCGLTVAWTLQAGVLVRTDSTNAWLRYGAKVGPDAWLINNGISYSYRVPKTGPNTQLRDWEGYRVEVSPQGHRMLPIEGAGIAATGIPLWDPRTMVDIANRIGHFRVAASRFSNDGDTAFTLTGDNNFVHLTAIRSSDGGVQVAGDSLEYQDCAGTTCHLQDLVLDQGRPWIYVIGAVAATGPKVLVVDRRTMRVAGRLVPSAGQVPTGGTGANNELFGHYSGFVDASTRRLYVVELARIKANKVYTFELLP